MRRAIPVLFATLGALALLESFHTSPAQTTAIVAAGPSTTDSSITAPPAPASPTGAPPTAPTTAKRPTTTVVARRSIDGPAVYTRFGNVQVRVVLKGSRIVDVQSLQLPFSHQRSQEISDQAGPWLRDEALQAQSANIATISGATYTSIGYRSSLQSALDRAARQ